MAIKAQFPKGHQEKQIEELRIGTWFLSIFGMNQEQYRSQIIDTAL